MKYEFKKLLVWLLCVFTLPLSLPGLLAYRWLGSERLFHFGARSLSLVPGRIGRYLRTSFYVVTLPRCGYDLALDLCSWVAHPTAEIGRGVVVGSFSIIGTATIGDDVLVASRVSVLSGKSQHPMPRQREQSGDREPYFERVHIGRGCWLGEGSIVMADLGEYCMISPGSVVTRKAPPESTAIGNPARFLKLSENAA